MASLYHRFGAFYSSSFSRRPWLTLAIANGTLGVIADSLAQNFEKQQARQQAKDKEGSVSSRETKGWDWARSGRFAAFGVGMAPILAEWNKFIEFAFPLRTNAASTSTTAGAAASTAVSAGKVSLVALGKRVSFDQVLFAPFGLVCFVGAMGAMEYGSWPGVKAKFSDMYMPALLANWQVWPLIQLVNFRFVPLRFRVPFTSSCGIAWTLYLSLLAAAKGKAEQGAEVRRVETEKAV
ncbi:hypothetical protein BDZ90DRAFT_268667 [Jaminaea rosea]|uniref:Uncharacterized protein n=1 Tax=Jaminaea rosea TaxID=1569628 RepID=A0A316UJ92_9BASI|nr:hypothetical protein BDZ90DRAFT_268667 [Jaminaea rosea]PWN24938.1 hypothetical protein BDZ90DRAFT_268667 [Jaminaea rosea]